MPSRRLFLSTIVAAVAAIHLGPDQVCASPTAPLVAAGNERHLWFVAESTRGDGFDLCHLAADSDPPAFARFLRLRQAPALLACWADQLWVSFADPNDPCPNGREVFTVQAVRNEALSIDYPSPADRLAKVPALPAGRIAGLAATADGPVALIWADPQDSHQAGEPGRASVALLALRHGRWTEIELPTDLGAPDAVHLAAAGSQGSSLLILRERTPYAAAVAHERQPDGRWTAAELNLDLSRLRSIVNVQDQAAVVLAGAGTEGWAFQYLRPPMSLPLALLQPPTGRWAVAAFAGDLAVLEHSPASSLLLSRIDGLTGAVSAPQTLVEQDVPMARLWLFFGSIGLAVLAIIAAYRMRGGLREAIALPSGLELLPISSRVMAAALDVLPAAVIALLATGAPLRDLWVPPFSAVDLAGAFPYLVMVALMALHTTASELLTATTLGKALLGAKVATVSGARPQPTQLARRVAFKAIVLLIPPLALWVVANRYSQGLHDLAAGTLVVRDTPAPSDAQG